jgi:ubiquitin-activating enzyme E1
MSSTGGTEDLLSNLSTNDTANSASDDLSFQNRFSRQIATMGLAAVKKLASQRVLIVGCSSVGVETAKNVILQGTRAVTLFDPTVCCVHHLGGNFCTSSNSIGQPLDKVSVPKLSELNKECAVTRVDGALTDDVLKAHSVVVITLPLSRATLEHYNKVCREHTVDGVPSPIAFMYCFTGGVFASVFVDHGDEHVITDADGEAPLVRIVNSISTDQDGGLVRFTVPDGQPAIAIEDGSVVEFNDVEGMSEVNGKDFLTRRDRRDPVNSLRISDTSGFSAYVTGGTMTEKKQATTVKFRSLAACFEDPGELPMTDMINFGVEYKHHDALKALLKFQDANGGALPKANDEGDMEAVLKFMGEEGDADLTKALARHAALDLQPMGAFLGGVIAQEVVKCSGKYTPINGFLHFNALETLGKEVPKDTAAVGSRYDNLIQIFGKAFVDKLGDLNYFMVGCGALGCEFLKNFAMNGICCGETGKLTVTDADRVELSNLARQFLFREDTVGKPKSTSACAKATQMNPAFRPEALEMFVGPNTESTFDDTFWMSLDGVCNALDNMEARFYVDKQCVRYGKR